MGPRSHERGNKLLVAVLGGAMCRSELQWGRVLTNAETGDLAVESHVGVDASMGPRSHERGNPLHAQGRR